MKHHLQFEHAKLTAMESEQIHKSSCKRHEWYVYKFTTFYKSIPLYQLHLTM